MFGYRTPLKNRKEENLPTTMPGNSNEKAGPSQKKAEVGQASVRRSIGEWESGRPDAKTRTQVSPVKTVASDSQKPKPKQVLSQDKPPVRRASVEAAGSPPKQVEKSKYVDRLSEARACVTKAKLHLGNSRNLKTEIKAEVLAAIDRLYQIVKEAESTKGGDKKRSANEEKQEEKAVQKKGTEDNTELIRKLEEHSLLMKESTEKMEKFKETLERQTYASVAAAPSKRQLPEHTALHSVVVTGKDDMETGEEVLNRIRKAVNAKEGGVFIEKIRKAKDRKVIVGCRTEEEKQEVTKRIRTSGEKLNVEDIKNKNPLVILKDILTYNTDEEILCALQKQNRHIFEDLDSSCSKMEIAFKKRTRNPLTSHIVLRVSPIVWQRMVEAETVHVDLQRVRVADQSPLVQCSLCLGYGHGKRFCREALEKCSHCGGPHKRAQCADWLAGEVPSCCNCLNAKLDKTDHNAFSQDCPVRRKWESLARATIAYC